MWGACERDTLFNVLTQACDRSFLIDIATKNISLSQGEAVRERGYLLPCLSKYIDFSQGEAVRDRGYLLPYLSKYIVPRGKARSTCIVKI